jgi:hypothetical protein
VRNILTQAPELVDELCQQPPTELRPQVARSSRSSFCPRSKCWQGNLSGRSRVMEALNQASINARQCAELRWQNARRARFVGSMVSPADDWVRCSRTLVKATVQT